MFHLFVYDGAHVIRERPSLAISADPLTWAPNDPRPRGYVRQGPFYMLRRANMDSGIDSLTRDMVYSNIIRGAINSQGALNPFVLHLYTYVGNNPINGVDPFGYVDWETAKKWKDIIDIITGQGGEFTPEGILEIFKKRAENLIESKK